MIGIQRIFKIIDDDNSGFLEIEEFWKGLRDFRLKFSEDECRHLFSLFDLNNEGRISIDELIIGIKG
jgi:Ca2+-binding EF-hand superfamily protein